MTDTTSEWCPDATLVHLQLAQHFVSVIRQQTLSLSLPWDELHGVRWIRDQLRIAHSILYILDDEYIQPDLTPYLTVAELTLIALPTLYCRVELSFLSHLIDLGGSHNDDILQLCHKNRYSILRFFSRNGKNIKGM